ncbi:MAG: PAS domain-containing protein [Proteobacteria bacterium]|nr:PAS domain-containing protein [Pseudomonadota bacterium]
MTAKPRVKPSPAPLPRTGAARNHQLRDKIAELETAHGNLNNVIVSSEIATLWLDRDLRIKWSTPAMEREFHVLATDAGRPVSDLGPPLTDAGLLEDVKAVLKRLAPIEHEQTTPDGRHFIRRIVPFSSTTGHMEGVIVTFFNTTISWQTAREAIEARKAQAEALEEQVRERTRQMRELALALTQVEENERRNLAQNLHDDLAQVLSIVQIKLAEVGKGGLEPGARATLQEIGEMLSRVSRTVQSLAFQLSPSVLYELGLTPAIDWLAEEMRRLYGLKVAVHDDGNRKDLDDQAKITVYRAVRELLINVAKHAKVNVAEVRSRSDKGFVLVEVTDGGAGFDTGAVGNRKDRGGFGLVNVRERLELIGGTVTIVSLPGDGTTVTLAVPLRKAGKARRKKERT